jgi:two-component system nitrate/nitrite response regulator NarL
MLIESWEQMKVVGDTGDEVEALALAKMEDLDVILIELDFKAGRGDLDLLTKMLSASNARVIVLTHLQDIELHHLAIRSGARGLVLKEHSPEQLRSAILKVHSGEVWLDSKLTTSIITRMARSNRLAQDGKESATFTLLSPREQELAWLAGDGLSNKEIAERLFISDTTVRHHMTSVFRKLGVANRLELIISLLRPTAKKPPAPSMSRDISDKHNSSQTDSDPSSGKPSRVASVRGHAAKRKFII